MKNNKKYRAIICVLLFSVGSVCTVWGAEKAPVYIGLDAEFGYISSTSAEAIREGVLIAMEEINKAGGVWGGA